MSALITTFGVGELSAINAIAGSAAELVPVIHIVGFPSTVVQEKKLPMHHTLADDDYELFMKMSERLSSAAILLKDPLQATKMIDDTIIECYRSSKPVYIGFPMDLVGKEVDPSLLEHPLELRLTPPLDTSSEKIAIKAVMDRLQKAENPIILVDSLAGRYESLNASRALVEESNIPSYSFPMAKGVINEKLPNFRGIYAAGASGKGVEEEVKASDLVLIIGQRTTDLNTGGFKADFSGVETIVLHRDTVEVGGVTHSDISLERFLGKLTGAIATSASNSPISSISPSGTSSSPPSSVGEPPELSLKGTFQNFQGNKLDTTAAVEQEWLWKRISTWLEEDDILAMDVGTSCFGGLWCQHPRGVQSLFQLLWSSIGYAVGATLGAAIAAREHQKEKTPGKPQKRRIILFTGDGSLQMTAQELSTMIRQELGIIIFVICNNGYTIERYINGWDKRYNDIQPWDHTLLPAAFSAKPEAVRTYRVHTQGELEALLTDDQFGPAENFNKENPEPLRLVEIHMDKHDAPQSIPDMISSLHGKK